MKKLLLPSIIIATIFTGSMLLNNVNAQHHADVKTLWSIDSASTKKDPDPPMDAVKQNDTIEVNVGNVESYGYGGYIVRLEPKYEMTDVYLPVVIGECETNGIQMYKSGTLSSRPMTYDMFTNLLAASDMKINKVIVTKLESSTYYAVIMLSEGGKKIEVDSRPSDAINMGLRAGAKIYVMRKVLEEAGEKN
ncbi:MAG: bifunctional nuclease family protein [Bacteroidetes bacterium]|nr:bifunctional nuclease family protein [Bacteroidota bacterium]